MAAPVEVPAEDERSLCAAADDDNGGTVKVWTRRAGVAQVLPARVSEAEAESFAYGMLALIAAQRAARQAPHL